MDILFPDADNRKLCVKCHLLKSPKKFYRKNDWCRQCLKKASENVPPGKKFCTLCKAIKLVDEFSEYPNKSASWCRECERKVGTEWSRKHPVERLDQNLRKMYGITLETYNQMLEAQGGVCEICKETEGRIDPRTKSPVRLEVDHCHVTGKVRALLCHRCNTIVGYLEVDMHSHGVFLEYIRRWQSGLERFVS